MSNSSSSMSFDDVPTASNNKSNVSYRKIHSSTFVNEEDLGEMVEQQTVLTKDQLEEFKEVIRANVLESLLIGL